MSERKNLIESKIAQIDDKATKRQKEAAKLYFAALEGDLSAKFRLQEGITTSDIPELLTPAFNVQFLAEFAAQPVVWNQISDEFITDSLGEITFGDFQFDTSNLPAVNDGDEYVGSGLPGVGELQEYPAISFVTSSLKESLRKNGVRMRWSWESLRKLGNFDMVGKSLVAFARMAAEQEDVSLGKQFVSTAGVINTGFTTLASNPALTLDSLGAAKSAFGKVKIKGNRASAPRFALVTGSGLSEVARNLLSITQVTNVPSSSGGQSYIQTTNNGNVSAVDFAALDSVGNYTTAGTTDDYWFLVPRGGARPAFITAFLEGNRMPLVSTQDSQHFYAGGGQVPAREGDFSEDAIQSRGRHVVESAALQPSLVIRSNGTAS